MLNLNVWVKFWRHQYVPKIYDVFSKNWNNLLKMGLSAPYLVYINFENSTELDEVGGEDYFWKK